MSENKVIDVVQSKDIVLSKLGTFIETSSVKAIRENGNFKIGLSGGSLIGMLKEILPTVKTSWEKWIVFFCDERIVPETDSDSNFGTFKAELLDVIPLKDIQFVTINHLLSAKEAAADYEIQLKKWFPGVLYPVFDVLLLGMGPDGHTCSLFPGHESINATSWVTYVTDSPKPPPLRITLTFPVLNAAKMCIFPICGSGKADCVKAVLQDQEDLPAGKVLPKEGKVVWLLDASAASKMSGVL